MTVARRRRVFNVVDGRQGPDQDSAGVRSILRTVFSSNTLYFTNCQRVIAAALWHKCRMCVTRALQVAFVLKTVKAHNLVSAEQRAVRTQRKIKITQLITT
jgi:hypothetical protein